MDGYIEPAGSAELTTSMRVGGEAVNHYMCSACNELFEARDDDFVVHDCPPPAAAEPPGAVVSGQ